MKRFLVLFAVMALALNSVTAQPAHAAPPSQLLLTTLKQTVDLATRTRETANLLAAPPHPSLPNYELVHALEFFRYTSAMLQWRFTHGGSPDPALDLPMLDKLTKMAATADRAMAQATGATAQLKSLWTRTKASFAQLKRILTPHR